MPTERGSPSFTNTSGKTGLLGHQASPTQSGYFMAARCSCRRTSTVPKTVGLRFGHAGALVQREEDSAAAKASLLRAAGVHVADALADIPSLVRG